MLRKKIIEVYTKRSEMQIKMAAIIKTMRDDGQEEHVISYFKMLLEQMLSGQKTVLSGTGESPDILPVSDADSHQVARYDNLVDYIAIGQTALAKGAVAVVKLNGGLATSMGLEQPKSTLEVKDGKTFLDIMLAQLAGTNADLLFLNSPSTSKPTGQYLKEKHPDLQYKETMQGRGPKLDLETLAPATHHDSEKNFNPLGHGEVFPALYASGAIDRLLEKGVKYILISNADNLGATVDPRILGYMKQEAIPFIMEVAERTELDSKGGHLAKDAKGRLTLRESAQCPKDEQDDFQNTDKWGFFNTNNLWVDLVALKKLMDENGGVLKMAAIRNVKDNNPSAINPTKADERKVVQVEAAMGSAISQFAGASAVVVPRTRFAPVKKFSDLLAIMSDASEITKEGTIVFPKGMAPIIKLAARYSKPNGFYALIAEGVPSMKNLDRLELEGNGQIVFEAGLVLRGTLKIINNTTETKTLTQAMVDEAIANNNGIVTFN